MFLLLVLSHKLSALYFLDFYCSADCNIVGGKRCTFFYIYITGKFACLRKRRRGTLRTECNKVRGPDNTGEFWGTQEGGARALGAVTSRFRAADLDFV